VCGHVIKKSGLLSGPIRIITKKYYFTINKKFQPVERYAITRHDSGIKSTLEQAIKKLTRKNDAPDGGRVKKAEYEQLMIPWYIFKLMGVILILSGVGLGFIVFQNYISPGAWQIHPATPPTLHYEIADKAMLSSGSDENQDTLKKDTTAFVLLNITSRMLDNVTVKMKVYARQAPENIYLLDIPQMRTQDSYSEFVNTLSGMFTSIGTRLNIVGIADLEGIPPNSVIIVPTTYIPASLLGLEESQQTLQTLMGRGITIIYIGLPFDAAIMKDGKINPIPPAVYDKYGLQFNYGASPAYIDLVEDLNNPRFYYEDNEYTIQASYTHAGQITVSVLNGYGIYNVQMGDGNLIIVPQAFDGAWLKSGRAAAANIFTLVDEIPWLDETISNSYPVYLGKWNGSFILPIYTQAFEAKSGYVRLVIDGYSDGKILGMREQFYLQKGLESNIYIKKGPIVIPTYVNNGDTKVTLVINEQSQQQKKLDFQILDRGTVIDTQSLSDGEINLQVTRIPNIQMKVVVPPGVYVLRVVDKGKHTYAQALLDVSDVYIAYGKSFDARDYIKGVFKFDVMDRFGERLMLNDVKVMIDNDTAKVYEFKGVNNIALYEVHLSEGPHEFAFTFGGRYTKRLTDEYIRPRFELIENPVNFTLIVIAIGTFGAAFFFKPKERLIYNLDIPDFPPVMAQKLFVKKSAVLGLFNTINTDYGWANMPLRAEELKKGLRTKLTYMGKPLVIGDYNLERILDVLMAKKQVEEHLQYYSLTEWAAADGKSLRFLSMGRAMRDICLKYIIKFTKGGGNDSYDMMLVVGKEIMCVNFFDSDYGVIPKLLKNSHDYRSILLFEDRWSKNRFMEQFNSTQKEMVMLKINHQYGRILLLTVDEADKFLSEVKGMRK